MIRMGVLSILSYYLYNEVSYEFGQFRKYQGLLFYSLR
jgi:hypothetical protein